MCISSRLMPTLSRNRHIPIGSKRRVSMALYRHTSQRAFFTWNKNGSSLKIILAIRSLNHDGEVFLNPVNTLELALGLERSP